MKNITPHSLLISILFFTSPIFGYDHESKDSIKHDTLFIQLIQTDTSDKLLNSELALIFDSIVNKFNRQYKHVKIIIDSVQRRNSLKLTMGEIQYGTMNRSLWLTGLNLTLIGANILILPYFPPIIPFYFYPTTNCKISIENNSKTFRYDSKMFIAPGAYFKNKQKQKIKFKKEFEREIGSLFKEMNRQYLRSTKKKRQR